MHRVFLVRIDKKDEYRLVVKRPWRVRRDETLEKTNLWKKYQRLLARNVPQFPEAAYCGRRSLPTEELQRYFEERAGDIEELEEKLKAWHGKS